MGGTRPAPPMSRGHPRSGRGGDKQGGALAPPYPRQLLMLGRREEAPGPLWVSWRGDSTREFQASLGGFPPVLSSILHPFCPRPRAAVRTLSLAPSITAAWGENVLLRSCHPAGQCPLVLLSLDQEQNPQALGAGSWDCHQVPA